MNLRKKKIFFFRIFPKHFLNQNKGNTAFLSSFSALFYNDSKNNVIFMVTHPSVALFLLGGWGEGGPPPPKVFKNFSKEIMQKIFSLQKVNALSCYLGM